MGSNPMFPIILYSYSPSYFINLININTSRRNLFFYIQYTRKTLVLINFFKKINFFESYSIVKINDKFFFKVSPFYYKNLNLKKNFKLLSSSSRKYFISLKALTLLNKRSGTSLYILSTSKGIITHKTAIKKKLSGFLLGFFHS